MLTPVTTPTHPGSHTWYSQTKGQLRGATLRGQREFPRATSPLNAKKATISSICTFVNSPCLWKGPLHHLSKWHHPLNQSILCPVHTPLESSTHMTYVCTYIHTYVYGFPRDWLPKDHIHSAANTLLMNGLSRVVGHPVAVALHEYESQHSKACGGS